MCGLAGAIQLDVREETWQTSLPAMASAIRYRGPDDEGIWYDVEAGIGLAHRRLSILDLSPDGHQPMVSATGRYVIAYNGEVYNYLSIKKELERSEVKWRGHSDTEVILAAVEAWGIESSINKFVGMFALALWDRKERVLFLVRDRLGIKPLYYGWIEDAFVFGSELKALKAHPSFSQEVSRDALTLFLRHNYIPAPYSIYGGIFKLKPAHVLRVPVGSGMRRESVSDSCFWSARDSAESGQENPFAGTEEDAAEELENLLNDSIGLRMISDVPLGAFLSGGIDSSMVVALMQAQSGRPIKTFTIGFTEQGFNEAEHAKLIAQHLATEHTELYVTPEQAMSVVPKLPHMFDEPFSDSSQIPTFLVSALARQHVTVSLSGDGGDELFAGYGRYAAAQKIWTRIGWMPNWLSKSTAHLLLGTPNWMLDAIPGAAISKISRYGRPGSASDKLKKIAEILTTNQFEDLYRALVSHWKCPSDIVINGQELPTTLTDKLAWANLKDPVSKMMYLDMMTYLPDDILAKVDRASMAVSLEARVPLLDHRVVEFAWRLPLSMKVKSNVEKHVLRSVLYKHVPKELLDRPKMGFGIPINAWLRGPLREWGENLLDEGRLEQEGMFNAKDIRKKWDEHLTGGREWHYYLWDVLMFQAWLEVQ